jgi:hypothetical protein
MKEKIEKRGLDCHCHQSARTVPMPSIHHCRFVVEEMIVLMMIVEIALERIDMTMIVEIVEIVEIVVEMMMNMKERIVVKTVERKNLGWHCRY